MSLRVARLTIVATAICTMSSAWCSPTDWKLKISDTKAGIEIYTRISDRGYPEFRGRTVVKSRLSAFIALFRDVDNMPNWVYRTKAVEVLQRLNDREVHVYTVHSMPSPLADRDSIVYSTLTQNPSDLSVTIEGHAHPEDRVKEPHYVRMPVVESFWKFTPLGTGMVEVVFQGFGDPGGALSSGVLAWFVQFSIGEAPHYTLAQLRKMITRPQYQSTSYPFVTEPAS